MDVVLASKSPRRRELLSRAGVRFRVVESHASEDLPAQAWDDPIQAVQELAARKAEAVAQALGAAPGGAPALVVGADTVVVLDGVVFGKPSDAAGARRMLQALSGRAHQVATGVSVWQVGGRGEGPRPALGGSAPVSNIDTFAEVSLVFFKDLSPKDVEDYLAEGESLDKAGAYAIQGKGSRLVERYEGDYDNIVGLPVAALLRRHPQLVG